VLRGAKVHGLDATFTVTPAQVEELLALVHKGEISGKQAKEVYAAIEGTDKSPVAIVNERGLRVVSDGAAIQAVCERVIATYPEQAASVRAGKKGVLGFLVGQVMKETKGSANPKLVSEMLEKLTGN
jgi:aspartyl-tRNA(Asn)/glutamyl-tRNA(Gln) amidotransferase subunit B